MVGSENERKTAGQTIRGTVREGIGGMTGNEMLVFKDLQIRSEGEAA